MAISAPEGQKISRKFEDIELITKFYKNRNWKEFIISLPNYSQFFVNF